MNFWWYIEWPEEIRKNTLIYVRNNKDGTLISINVLEYAAILVNYAAAYHFYHNNHDPSDPFPMVLFYANNGIRIIDGEGVQQVTLQQGPQSPAMRHDDEQQCRHSYSPHHHHQECYRRSYFSYQAQN